MQTSDTLPLGTILNSGIRKYEILSVLGQGGFGITYLAKSEVLVDNIPVEAFFAIKEHYISKMNEREGMSVVISNENNRDEINESIDSFITEAKRLNKLSLHHPGIVRVNENFKANDTAYYVMEYIKGSSVRNHIRQTKTKKLSEKDALLLFRPIAETIGYLHKNKVTHLDIKPDNILIRENGKPVIIDFGLSKHYNSKGTPTSTIKTLGCSDGYSPMEQYAGITTFTPEADIYALAATLLYMLTGKDPIKSTEISPSIICNSLPSDISENTKSVLLKSMEKLKENRISCVEDLLRYLYSNADNINSIIDNLDKGCVSDLSNNEGTHYEKRTKKLETNYFKKRHIFEVQKKTKIIVSFLALLIIIFIVIVYSRANKSEIDTVSIIEPVKDSEIEEIDPVQIYLIAKNYENGTDGVDIDFTKALKYYIIAAEHGNINAMLQIGHLYDSGIGVEQNYEEAIKWYRKAAENESYVAQYYLGNCYEYGNGVDESLPVALYWFKRAAALGDNNAKVRIDSINSTFHGFNIDQNNLLPAIVVFPQGKSTLEEGHHELKYKFPQNASAINNVVNYMMEFPSKTITILGFTQSGGNEELNKALAKARADAVKKILLSHNGIDAERISVKGMGGTDIFNNNSRVMFYGE